MLKQFLAILLSMMVCEAQVLTGRATLSGNATLGSGVLNCVNNGPCTVIIPSGDSYSGTTFQGFADACLGTDPQTLIPWACYSSAKTLGDGTKVVEIHYAEFTGGIWVGKGALFTTTTMNNPDDNNNLYHSSHEVMSMYPQVTGGQTCWYAIHTEYWLPVGGQASTLDPRFQRWPVAEYCDPDGTHGPGGLGGVTEQYLGVNSAIQDATFPIAQNLQTGFPAISGVAYSQLHEPALVYDSSTLSLYITLQSINFGTGVQWSTPSPELHNGTWSWTYVTNSINWGTIADANTICSKFNICGQNAFFTEFNISRNKANTQWIAIANVAQQASGGQGFFKYGAVVMPLTQLSPPLFTRDGNNNVVVTQIIKSTDSKAQGPGSAAYDPGSPSGIIYVRKETGCVGGTPGCPATPALSFFVEMLATNLFP